jgi:hypothetical protein
MGGKYDMATVGHFVQFLDKDCTLGFQCIDHKAIMDNFVPHINGCAVLFERELDNFDCTVNARAKTARSGEQQFHRAAGSSLFSHVQCPLGNVAAPAKTFPLLRVAQRADKDRSAYRLRDLE